MKAPVAYGLGIVAAAALPVLIVAVVLAATGELFDLFTVKAVVWGAGMSLSVAAFVAAPALLLLHKLRAVRWRWLGVVGYVSGFLLYGSFLAVTRGDPFALPMTPLQLLIASAVGGAVGWVCASACWFTIRHLMRPNKSLERTSAE